MRKILSIINIAEANESNSLETDYQIERKNLKRYQQSLKVLKLRVFNNVSHLQAISKSLFTMHQAQSKSRKKASQIQYYMFNGIKVFGAMVSVFRVGASFYEEIQNKIHVLETKIAKCLKEQKSKFDKLSEQQEKEIKAFATECYPETNSILFMIGFISADKVVKRADSFRENSIVESSKRYSNFLNQCLDQMEELKKEAIRIGQEYYEGAKNMWMGGVESFQETLQSFSIDEDEINKIADETGRVLTDRSIKSNDQQQENNGEENEPEPAQFQNREQEVKN